MDESGAEYVVIIMHSVKQNKIPEKNGRIRIYDYHQKMSLTHYKEHGTKGTFSVLNLITEKFYRVTPGIRPWPCFR